MTGREIHQGGVYPAAQAMLQASAALENAPYELTAVTAGSVAPFASCGKGSPRTATFASSCGSESPEFNEGVGLVASCNVKFPQSSRGVEPVASCGQFPESGLGVGRVASCGGSPLNNNRGVEAVSSCGKFPETGLRVGRVASCGGSPLTVNQAASCSDI